MHPEFSPVPHGPWLASGGSLRGQTDTVLDEGHVALFGFASEFIRNEECVRALAGAYSAEWGTRDGEED